MSALIQTIVRGNGKHMKKRHFKKQMRKWAAVVGSHTFEFLQRGVHWRYVFDQQLEKYQRQIGLDQYLLEMKLGRLIFDYVCLDAPQRVLDEAEQLNQLFPGTSDVMEEYMEILLDNELYDRAELIFTDLKNRDWKPYNFTIDEYDNFIKNRNWDSYTSHDSNLSTYSELLARGEADKVIDLLDNCVCGEELDWFLLSAYGIKNDSVTYKQTLLKILETHEDIYLGMSFWYYAPSGNRYYHEILGILEENN